MALKILLQAYQDAKPGSAERAIIRAGVLRLLLIMREEAIARECAWCNAEMGIPQGNGSHGICPRHADEMYQSRHARKAA